MKEYIRIYQAFHNYEKVPIESVWFGLFDPQEGVPSRQAKMEWRPLVEDNTERFAAKLVIYDDVFVFLSSFKDLFDALSQEENKRIDLNAFCDLLEQHGFRNKKEVTQV